MLAISLTNAYDPHTDYMGKAQLENFAIGMKLSLFGIGANEYHYFIMNLILINLIAALGLQLLVGFTGLLSLGHAAFMGVGAYTSALLITNWNCPFILSITGNLKSATNCWPKILS